MTGYLHPAYAASLSEFGRPRELRHAGGWIMERGIGDTPYRDAMGCYPLFVCRDWGQLGADLRELKEDLVSLVLVTDPFGDFTESDLQACFDRCVKFKEHFVVDTSQAIDSFVCQHHRYYARRSLREMKVEMCDRPHEILDEWAGLYEVLIQRHGLRGIKRFSRAAFEKQLNIPGMLALRAVCGGETVGMQLWFIQSEVAYSHLTALSEKGYKTRASYGLYWEAMQALRERVRWMDLGAGAGIAARESDGLDDFKKGWSNGVQPAYLCGKVFNAEIYVDLLAQRNLPETSYFPAYRCGELN